MTAIEHDLHRIAPLGADDIRDHETLAREIYVLLSDEHTLQFLPEKKLDSLKAAKNWVSTAMLNFYSGRNQVHLIRNKRTSALIGVIDLIPPAVAKEHYQLNSYPYFLEFYLKGNARGKTLMSRLLPKVVWHLEQDGIRELAAVVNKQNLAASKVLKRSGFKLVGNFDPVQNLYSLR
jgi:RimJ/RimL family protein N-acetyltransferase